MGKIGRYIDALPDRARDRVIEAQDWCAGSLKDIDGRRCLVGHADIVLELGGAADAVLFGIVDYFDRACARFGLARVVRACKLRAGRPNRIAIPAINPAAKEASDV